MEYLILGGGIAAASAMRSIREHDPEGGIVVISEEKPCFYYRPLIPSLLDGSRATADILPDEDLAGSCSALVIHDRAVSLEAESKRVRLSSGQAVSFDRLLIATGCQAFIPDIPGRNESLALPFRTLDHAISIRSAAEKSESAVVAGAGPAGIKAALGLSSLKLKVTVIEQLPQVLPQCLDTEGAGIAAARLRRAGIEILAGETITEFLSGGKGVRLASGKVIEAGFVLLSMGARPDLKWALNSGLAVHKGIIVDEKLQTNIPDVFAAGDVVEITGLISGKPEGGGLWRNAVEMGKTAGLNMAGGSLKYSGHLSVMNSMEIEGLPMISAGAVHDGAARNCDVMAHRDGENYRKLVFRGDRLIGAVFMGDISRAGVYTSLIRSQRPFDALLKDRARQHLLCYADLMFKELQTIAENQDNSLHANVHEFRNS